MLHGLQMDNVLSLLTSTLPKAGTTEQLARPLLSILHAVTGMESTYVTQVDLDNDVQHVTFSHNTASMQIPEGLSVPWEDTLCKRALDSGHTYTPDVPACWGDSVAAQALGIQTYVSVPVRTHDGRLLGTLCATSASKQALPDKAEPILHLFSSLLGTFMEREDLLSHLQEANARLSSMALTDALTGLPNRRAILDALPRMLEQAERDGRPVLVGSIDLDGFKSINDTFGHQAGDLFLWAIGQRLAGVLRGEDMLGRLGGDEFVVLAHGALDSVTSLQQQASTLQQRLFQASCGEFDLSCARIAYDGASVGVVALEAASLSAEAALMLADAAMYREKQARRIGRHASQAFLDTSAASRH